MTSCAIDAVRALRAVTLDTCASRRLPVQRRLGDLGLRHILKAPTNMGGYGHSLDHVRDAPHIASFVKPVLPAWALAIYRQASCGSVWRGQRRPEREAGRCWRRCGPSGPY